jgi:uncharacterized lipoprotein YehR (DUF1307 family)
MKFYHLTYKYIHSDLVLKEAELNSIECPTMKAKDLEEAERRETSESGMRLTNI